MKEIFSRISVTADVSSARSFYYKFLLILGELSPEQLF